MQLLNGQIEQPTLFTMDNAFSDIFQTIDNHGNVLNLIEVDGVPYTTSRMIAEKFNKQHGHVIRDMDEIKERLSRLGETSEKPYFIESSYIHEQNKQEYREILISKKGCILYMFNIQGYLSEKMLFIESFEKMEQALKTPPKQPEGRVSRDEPRKCISWKDAPSDLGVPETPELTYIRSNLKKISKLRNLDDIYNKLNKIQTFIKLVEQ